MKNATDISVILDRSGSMQQIKTDMEGGFNAFIEGQKTDQTDEATVSLYTFDDRYETEYQGKNVNDVPKLTIYPRGMTRLFDAIGRTINSTGERLGKMNEWDRPNRVIIVVVTDGVENDSKEFTEQQIKQMITHQREVYNWTFVFLGANQDALKAAQAISIPQTSSITFAANQRGVTSSMRSLSMKMSSFRKGSVQACSFDADDYKEQEAAGVAFSQMKTNPSIKSLTKGQILDLKERSRSLVSR